LRPFDRSGLPTQGRDSKTPRHRLFQLFRRCAPLRGCSKRPSLSFALVGGLWLMWWLGFNLSVAVAVGFIALAGVAAETGVVMLIYISQALAEIKGRREAEGRMLARSDVYDAIMEGAVERVRPKMMTVVGIMAGLLPIMCSTDTGGHCSASQCP
jgi:Cu/Ag efflux pump CusA